MARFFRVITGQPRRWEPTRGSIPAIAMIIVILASIGAAIFVSH